MVSDAYYGIRTTLLPHDDGLACQGKKVNSNNAGSILKNEDRTRSSNDNFCFKESFQAQQHGH
jgi:hypothetical protein